MIDLAKLYRRVMTVFGSGSGATGAVAMPADPRGSYRHYKGNLYRVIGLAKHSETHEPLIVYVAEDADAQMWVRPAGMFFETVDVAGRRQPRFQRMDD